MTRPGPPDPLAVYPCLPAGAAGLVAAAPAKLNLFLEVLGKRPDGFHALESLMVAVDLFDTLEVQPGPAGRVRLDCDPPGLPTGPDNLVVKAAVALRTHVRRPQLGADVRLTKRIPTQAGLAGGSADAALALLALNRVWKLGLTPAELAGIAAGVGSDVAFFLSPPAGWCTGRGEVVTPEPAARPLDFVLVCPPVGLATADVYRRLAPPAEPVGGDALRAAVRAGDPEAVGRLLFNRLEEPAFALAPVVGRICDRLAAAGPCGARMSGSGSAVFAVCRSREHAQAVAAAFRAARPADEPVSRVLVVRSLTSDPA
ncbi:MAG: 4-(cytidine 5'-diphospho)-2-C-methyl-D-erythritol kinase [Isosphaera sp.]|nr:4-(cytidine 5'-diphospho)-2-C-methyl-D-erythritol kinase [Isosphaera sp.]